jgi:TRAP-type transport system periplasmic protein
LIHEEKDVLQRSVKEAAQMQRKAVADKEAEDLAFLKSKGMVVVEKPNVEAFRKATASVCQAMADVVPPALVNKAREIK